MTAYVPPYSPSLNDWQRQVSGALNPIFPKLDNIKDVKADFGAIGDGQTDDTKAFQAAATSGARTFIPPGTYVVTSAITASNPVHFFGIGNQSGPGAAEQDDATSSRILAKFANPTVFQITSTRASIFRDFKMDIDPAYRSPASGAGIYLTAPTGATSAKSEIHNVTLNHFYQCIKLTRPNYHRITGCYFGSWVQDAIYSETDDVTVEGSTGYIENNYFFGETGGSAINQRSCVYLANGYVIVRGNEVLGAQVGVLVSVANFPAGFIHVHDNTIEEQYYKGVSVQTNSNKAIATLSVHNNEFSCITNGASYICSVFVDENSGTNYLSSVNVSSNQCRHQLSGLLKKHFWIGNGKNISIRGNQFEELGAASPNGVQVSGATVNTGLAAPVLIVDNIFMGTFGSRYSLASNPSAVVVDYQGLAFADLPTNAGNGSQIFCTDGTFANPVAAAGTGCFAKRINGAWRGD